MPDSGWPPGELSGPFVLVAASQAPNVRLPVVQQEALDRFLANGPKTILTDDHAPVDQLLAPVFAQAMHH